MKAVIDRIGSPFAVLVLPEEGIRFNLPAALLPEGCSEGDIVTITLERDDAACKEARDRAERFIAGLIGKN